MTKQFEILDIPPPEDFTSKGGWFPGDTVHFAIANTPCHLCKEVLELYGRGKVACSNGHIFFEWT